MGKFDQFKPGLPQLGARGALAPAAGVPAIVAAARAAPGHSATAERIIQGATPLFVIALDATGSMAGLIDAAKESIGQIITRASAEAGQPIELQLIAYRDYDCGHKAMESSKRSALPQELLGWLAGIGPEGGGANDGEAVELALTAVLANSEVRAVIVAGDEPPNSARSIVAAGRQSPTAVELAARLGERNTPVHTFVVGARPTTIRDFKKMAACSGGQSGRLDGSAEMIDMAVMAILSALKGRSGVDAYMKRARLTENSQQFGALLLNGPA